MGIFLSIIIFMYVQCIYGSEVEQTIIAAVMSYEKPKQYADNAKEQIKKTFGKDAILFLNLSNSLARYNTITIPIKYSNSNIILNLKNNEVNFLYSRGF